MEFNYWLLVINYEDLVMDILLDSVQFWTQNRRDASLG
jgi:hypothetical protein